MPIKTTKTKVTNKPPAPKLAQTENRPGGKPAIDNPAAALKSQNLTLLDVIAPEAVQIDFNHLKINNVYLRTLFVSGYPRFVSPGWLETIINFDSSLDISFYIYPIEGKGVLDEE